MTLKIIRPIPITDARFVSAAVPETEHAAWSSGTTYAINDTVIYAHRIYQSLQSANTNHLPEEADSLWWNDLSPTNQWAVFDQTASTQSTLTTSGGMPTWWVRIKPGPANAVFVQGMAGAASVRVQMFNGATSVYDQTRALDGSIITNAWQYYFAPFDVLSDILFDDLPPYYNAEILITVTPPSVGGVVKCASVIVGQSIELGQLLRDVGGSGKSYSAVVEDAYGNWTLVKRRWAKQPRYRFIVDNANYRLVDRALSELVDVPTAIVASDDYRLSPINVFGFVRQFDHEKDTPTSFIFNMQVQEL